MAAQALGYGVSWRYFGRTARTPSARGQGFNPLRVAATHLASATAVVLLIAGVVSRSAREGWRGTAG